MVPYASDGMCKTILRPDPGGDMGDMHSSSSSSADDGHRLADDLDYSSMNNSSAGNVSHYAGGYGYYERCDYMPWSRWEGETGGEHTIPNIWVRQAGPHTVHSYALPTPCTLPLMLTLAVHRVWLSFDSPRDRWCWAT